MSFKKWNKNILKKLKIIFAYSVMIQTNVTVVNLVTFQTVTESNCSEGSHRRDKHIYTLKVR